jgi:tRNA U34 5-methylaminomethyl-2-thiouridine-forming methyltransferase MnmC
MKRITHFFCKSSYSAMRVFSYDGKTLYLRGCSFSLDPLRHPSCKQAVHNCCVKLQQVAGAVNPSRSKNHLFCQHDFVSLVAALSGDKHFVVESS